MAMGSSTGLVDEVSLNLIHRACVGDLPTRAAQHFPDRLAVVDATDRLTYRDLEDRTNSVARGLLESGLGRGDVAAIFLSNGWEFLVAYFACAKVGIVAMPINLGLSPRDVAYQLEHAGTAAVIVDQQYARLVDAAATPALPLRQVFVLGDVPPRLCGLQPGSFASLLEHDAAPVEVFVDDRDILQCLYTSGTTSAPKAVLTSHVAVTITALSCALQYRHQRGDQFSVFPIFLPLFHVTALDSLSLPVLLTGGTVVLHQKYDADELLKDLADLPVTHLMMLPSMWAEFAQRVDEVTPGRETVQMAVYAMAPMPESTLDAIRRAFPAADVLLGSGQTEFTPPTVFQWPSHQWEKNASWGAAVATTDVRIMGPDGTLLARGEEGEIVYRGPQCMQEYGADAEANRAAFAHGWFHSGDVGYIDEAGVVWFTDRIKDMVKTGGENVSSVEVERVMLGHEDVAECGVIGVPDARWGEAVTAVVVPAAGRSPGPESLRAHAKAHLAGYKVPKNFFVVGQLPKTSTGKIRKHELRAGIDKTERA